MRRIRALLLLMCLVSVFVLLEKPIEAQESSPVITLEETYPIEIPHLSIGANWTYPYAQIPVLSENQSINGILSGAKGAVEICISPFNVNDFLSTLKIHKSCSGQSLDLNLTLNFTLTGINSGLYALSALDANSTLLAASYLLVSKENLSLQLPDNITAGEPLKVKANITLKDNNQSLIFGAIMI